jgi:hypothetical protein
VGEDLRPFISQIYNQDIGCLKDLKVLRFDRCQIDFFQPQSLSEKIKIISLEGNKIAALDVKMGWEKVEGESDSDDEDEQAQ